MDKLPCAALFSTSIRLREKLSAQSYANTQLSVLCYTYIVIVHTFIRSSIGEEQLSTRIQSPRITGTPPSFEALPHQLLEQQSLILCITNCWLLSSRFTDISWAALKVLLLLPGPQRCIVVGSGQSGKGSWTGGASRSCCIGETTRASKQCLLRCHGAPRPASCVSDASAYGTFCMTSLSGERAQIDEKIAKAYNHQDCWRTRPAFVVPSCSDRDLDLLCYLVLWCSQDSSGPSTSE